MEEPLHDLSPPDMALHYLANVALSYVPVPHAPGVYYYNGAVLSLGLGLLAGLDAPGPRDPYVLELSLYPRLELVKDLFRAPGVAPLALADEYMEPVRFHRQRPCPPAPRGLTGGPRLGGVGIY